MGVGRLRRFDPAQGYGFIAPEDGGEDVFVHENNVADLAGDLVVGARIEYEAVRGDRGLKAVAARVLTPFSQSNGSAPTRIAVAPPAAGLSEVDDDDDDVDILTEGEFRKRVTEILIDRVPSLTGAQITLIRSAFRDFADENGWIEP